MAPRRKYSGSITIEVYEVLDQIGDDDLLDEVRERKLVVGSINEPTDMEIVREAYDALLRHNAAEAQSILSRLLFPKWESTAACAAALRKLADHQSTPVR